MPETMSDSELSIEVYGTKAFLRPVQRQELERSIAGIEERLAEPILLEITGGDRDALEKQLVKERGMLERGMPPQLNITEQRRIYKKMQKCEDIIVNGLPTFTMMERGRPQDVDHHVAHENAPHRDEDGKYTTKRVIQAWKNYRLTLDPHSIEPNYLSIASLRTDTVRGNPALFRKNYDHIRFRELIEENLANQLDEETYFTFCGLKALDWSEATILRKLDWTQKMYDVAMERMRNDMLSKALQEQHEDERISEDVEDGAHVESAINNGCEKAVSQQEVAMSEQVKRGPRRVSGAILQKSAEPRVQIEPGWPKSELVKYGIGVGEFCKAWGQKSSTLYYKFVKDGQWVERHLKTARAALAKLIKERNSEPAGVTESYEGEPELAYDSTEPVSGSTAFLRAFGTKIGGKPV